MRPSLADGPVTRPDLGSFLTGVDEWRVDRQTIGAVGRFRKADQHRTVAAQQRRNTGRGKLGIELAEIFGRDRNDGDAGELSVDLALAADGKETGLRGARLENPGYVGALHKAVAVNLEVIAVGDVELRHRIHGA
jgi:hypothetical protein